MPKIKFHFSFVFFLLIFALLGEFLPFLALFTATTLHELTHIIAAKFYGLSVKKLLITPIGEVAYIEGLDCISPRKKIIIFASGPAFSVLSAIILYMLFGKSNEILLSFINFSLAIGFFNLLPIYPLDGGKMAFILLGNRYGILNSIKKVGFLTKFGIFLLFAIGFLQLIFYSYNFSLIAISGFLIAIYGKEKNNMIFSYYKFMVNEKVPKSGFIPVFHVFDENAEFSAVQKVFTWDKFSIVHFTENGKIIKTLTETEIMGHILDGGINKTAKSLEITQQNDI